MDSRLIFKSEIIKKRSGNFQLLDYDDIVTHYIISEYVDVPVLVIYDVNKFIDEIPRLKLLKRDNYSQYLLCEKHDILFASFHSINDAFDFISSLNPNMDKDIKWRIFFNHKVIYRSKI